MRNTLLERYYTKYGGEARKIIKKLKLSRSLDQQSEML